MNFLNAHDWQPLLHINGTGVPTKVVVVHVNKRLVAVAVVLEWMTIHV